MEAILVFGRYKRPINIEQIFPDDEAENIITPVKLSPFSFEYTSDIDNHLNYLFPGRKIGLHIDPSGDKYQIDINIMSPVDNEDYYVIYTSGMSSQEMLLPNGLAKEYPEFKRAELFMLLPKNWDVDNMTSYMPSHETYWPMQLLRMIGKFHYDFFTWIGPGYTIEYSSFAKNTKLSAAMVVSLGDEVSIMKTRDNKAISLYLVVPLYKEEVKFKAQHGYDAFIDKYIATFPPNNGKEWVVDINRTNIGI